MNVSNIRSKNIGDSLQFEFKQLGALTISCSNLTAAVVLAVCVNFARPAATFHQKTFIDIEWI